MKYLPGLFFILLSVSAVRADVITYDISNAVSHTLMDLGTKFIIGCAVLAAGFVIAAVISRKK